MDTLTISVDHARNQSFATQTNSILGSQVATNVALNFDRFHTNRVVFTLHYKMGAYRLMMMDIPHHSGEVLRNRDHFDLCTFLFQWDGIGYH